MKAEPPESGTSVVGDTAPRNAKEPETILRRGRYVLEASPGDGEDLGDYISSFVLGHTPMYIPGDRAVVSVVERLEAKGSVQPVGGLTHQRNLHGAISTALHGRHAPETVNRSPDADKWH